MKKLIAEVQVPDLSVVKITLEEPTFEKLIEAIHGASKTTEEIFIFEKDQDEELNFIENRSAISIITHRCKKISVHINFEHQTKSHTFSPSVTVYRVLNWAIGKKGFNLDDTARAKANLILPSGDSPLPREAPIGNYSDHKNCSLTLELTLRDFTNG